MGLRRKTALPVTRTKHAVAGCELWTRGGLDGLEIHIEDKVIGIPREIVLELIANEYKLRKIDRLEGMSPEHLIDEMMGVHR